MKTTLGVAYAEYKAKIAAENSANGVVVPEKTFSMFDADCPKVGKIEAFSHKSCYWDGPSSAFLMPDGSVVDQGINSRGCYVYVIWSNKHSWQFYRKPADYFHWSKC